MPSLIYCLFTAGSEGGSEQTRPLKSSSQEPSEPSTQEFDPVNDRRLTPPPQFESTKDHVIQIEEPETTTSTRSPLYITKEEDVKLQKPIAPSPSQDTQILSASALESQYKHMITMPEPTVTPPTPLKTLPVTSDHTASTSDSKIPEPSGSKSGETTERSDSSKSKDSQTSGGSRADVPEVKVKAPKKSTLGSPSRSAKVTPAPSPSPSSKSIFSDRGKSKVTGKTVSGWL